jgi:hypothetical protein
MQAVATSEEYLCPEPILLILGGSVGAGWVIEAYVYTSVTGKIQLAPVIPG